MMMNRHADMVVDDVHKATTQVAGIITVAAVLLLVVIRLSMERK